MAQPLEGNLNYDAAGGSSRRENTPSCDALGLCLDAHGLLAQFRCVPVLQRKPHGPIFLFLPAAAAQELITRGGAPGLRRA